MDNELPEGWVECSLGDVISLEYGKSLPAPERSGIGFPVMGSNGKVGHHTEYLVDGPGIIVGRKGSHGEVVWVEENFFPIDTTYYVKTTPSVTIKYAFNLLKSLDLKSLNRSTAIPGLNRTDAYEIPIPLPPLAEQTRIVAKLDAAFGHLETLKMGLARIPELLKKFRQTVLTQAVTGKLTEEWREENLQVSSKESSLTLLKNHLFDEIENPLYTSWVAAQIEDLLIPKGIFDGPFGSNLKTDDYTESGIRVVRLENVNQLSFDDSKKTYISEEKYLTLLKHTIFEGDIIFSSFISEDVRACILPDLGITTIAKADCFCLRTNQKLMLTKLLVFILCSEKSKNALIELAHGITRPRINTTQLRKLVVQVPPLEEQQEIVERVEALFAQADALEAQYQSLKAKIDRLPQALLAKAFRGELVPQNPADEPASVLLEKIKAATTAVGKKSRKTGQTTLAFMEE